MTPPIEESRTTNLSLEMAHVLFMDIVAYSKLPMEKACDCLGQLQESVRNTAAFARALRKDKLICLPTGDGMALVFFGDPESPVRCAVELSQKLHEHPEIMLRMGIHTGPVYRVPDINAASNVAGGGINVAQRVMDCGDAGHILVSNAVAEVLVQLSTWSQFLQDLGEVQVKHGVHVHIYNLHTGEAGNPELPQKLQAAAGTAEPPSTSLSLEKRILDMREELDSPVVQHWHIRETQVAAAGPAEPLQKLPAAAEPQLTTVPARTEPGKVEPPQTIGDYQVLSQLGSGDIGKVYKVRHVISKRTEALKLLRSDRTDSELAERFLREIRVLASFSHPHIAQFRTAFAADDRIAMVMEFIEGQDLRTKLRTHWPNRVAEGTEYLRQTLSALQYAHARGVIHRDVKPSNIVITLDGQAKLLDFSMAFTTADLSITRPGATIGSLHYMSPEQLRGERVDARSDLYSTGVTLYEIVTGRRPFDGKTKSDVINGHLSEQPKWPGDIDAAIPYELSATLMKAMAKERAKRFQTAVDFMDALANLSLGESLDEAASVQTVAVQPGERTSPSDSAKLPSGSSMGKPSSSASAPGRSTPPPSRITPEPSRTTPTPSRGRLDPSVLDSVSYELAALIGPIAKLVVKRAADRCSSVEDLYTAVAAEIGSEKDRSSFLARRKRHS